MYDIDKPCIRKCCLNEDDICLGCFRTYNDMLVWRKASTQDKKEMLQQAEERKKKYHDKC